MRNITKILLLVVVGFIVYLLWPRSPSLKTFDPTAVAALEVKNWQAQKSGKGFDALMARFKIYSSQYHFAPTSAFRISQNQGSALEDLKISRQHEGDPAAEGRAVSAMTEKYTRIKEQIKASFEADAMARDEIAWQIFEMDNAAPDTVLPPLMRILAGLYGGQPSDFAEVASNLLAARAAIFNESPPEGIDAMVSAREAYTLLKEIAATPPAETTAP